MTSTDGGILLMPGAAPVDTEAWVHELGKLIQDAPVRVWREDETLDAAGVRLAVVWFAPPGIFRDMPELRCIYNVGAGVDHLLCDPSLPTDLPIVRSEVREASAMVAQIAVHAVISSTRRLDEYRGQQHSRTWRKLPVRRPSETAIAVLGMGRIGTIVSRSLHDLGFKVVGWRQRVGAGGDAGIAQCAGLHALPALLSESDVVVAALPLTEATRVLLDRAAFATIKPGAFFVNVGRGEVVHEGALLHALESGRLVGAALDVFDSEPLPPDHPFWQHPNVAITPHIGGFGAGGMIEDVARVWYDLAAGRAPAGRIDRERGY